MESQGDLAHPLRLDPWRRATEVHWTDEKTSIVEITYPQEAGVSTRGSSYPFPSTDKNPVAFTSTLYWHNQNTGAFSTPALRKPALNGDTPGYTQPGIPDEDASRLIAEENAEVHATYTAELAAYNAAVADWLRGGAAYRTRDIADLRDCAPGTIITGETTYIHHGMFMVGFPGFGYAIQYPGYDIFDFVKPNYLLFDGRNRHCTAVQSIWTALDVGAPLATNRDVHIIGWDPHDPTATGEITLGGQIADFRTEASDAIATLSTYHGGDYVPSSGRHVTHTGGTVLLGPTSRSFSLVGLVGPRVLGRFNRQGWL